jgi:hypothetical protein
MMTNKDELLDKEAASWAALEAAIARVPADRRTEAGVVPGWSVKNLLWHSAWWAGWSGERLERMAAGTIASEDHDDAYWNGMNARIAEESQAMDWDEVVAGAAPLRERARAALSGMPVLTDEAVEYFTDETFDHYADHTGEIERFADSI